MTWISVLPVLFRTPTTHSRAEASILENQSAAERNAAEAGKRSFTTGQALAAEYQEIWGDLPETLADIDPRKPFSGGRDAIEAREAKFLAAYQEEVLERGQAALCLSGGGIRSAAFALGVIQALAQMRLLSKFHYLSTVSGGGYIGGWLNRLMKEETDQRNNRRRNGEPVATPFEIAVSVEQKLASDLPHDQDALRRLREVSNYLTPKVGPVTTDTWSTAALCIRNVLLNWCVFVPLLMLMAVVPNIFARLVDHVGGRTDKYACFFLIALILWGFGAMFVGKYFACSFLPSHKIGPGEPPRHTFLPLKGIAHIHVIVFGCLWALTLVFFVGCLSEDSGEITAQQLLYHVLNFQVLDYRPIRWVTEIVVAYALEPPDARLIIVCLVGVASWFVSMAAFLVAAIDAWNDDISAFLPMNIVYWALGSLIGSVLMVWGCFLLWSTGSRWHIDLAVSLGPLWVILAYVLQSSVYVGLRKRRRDDDDDREWIARVSAGCLRVMAAWAVLASASLLLSRLLWDAWGDTAWGDTMQAATALTGVGATLLAAFGGKSGLLTVGKAMSRSRKAIKALIAVATAIAIAGLLALFSRFVVNRAIDLYDLAVIYGPQDWGMKSVRWQDWLIIPLTGFTFLLIALVIVASRKIDVNQFSLHGVYRNRLARSFLGSAHAGREPHPFTGFDTGDNCGMWELASPDSRNFHNPAARERGAVIHEKSDRKASNPKRVLFPIINTALNLTSSERLAWQERKAMSFIISPICCGSADLQPETKECTLSVKERRDPCIPRLGAYVKSKYFGGNKIDCDQAGISLATAMTISGAAASPNMGYHSTPATAFLMTLFNLRLGAWLANPAIQSARLWQRSSPRTAVRPLISELSGQSNERGRYVYLSDGGHFENLGIYEMVRRRCRYIVVSDAGCDPGCTFEDLGNAVRKISIDLNVDICFSTMRFAKRDEVTDKTLAFAVGTIRYPDKPHGQILYIKPTYLKNLPMDVTAYGKANGIFPHESTADQWFSESQFESYRRLGFHLMSAFGERGGNRNPGSLEDLFRTASEMACDTDIS
jgi:hypothetical protein